jgi:hypothetical protein
MKNPGRFVPVNPSDINLVNQIKDGEQFLISIKKNRNPKHHKLIFGIAKCILSNLPEGHFLENQMPYDIIKAIMLDAGIVEYKLNLNGTTRAEPKSISFENMNEEEFEPVSNVIFEVGAKILGIEKHELEVNYLDYL